MLQVKDGQKDKHKAKDEKREDEEKGAELYRTRVFTLPEHFWQTLFLTQDHQQRCEVQHVNNQFTAQLVSQHQRSASF